MPKACIVARNRRGTALGEWGMAFGDGLKRHGWDVEYSLTWRASDLYVQWGVRRRHELAAQRETGGDICIVERGYLPDRFHWCSVGFGGGLNGRAEFRGTSTDPARLHKHYPGILKPWRETDGYALIMGQVPGDMSLQPIGGRLDAWYVLAAAELRQAGWDVRYRPHPSALARGRGRGPKGITVTEGTLDEALAGAGVVVTYNSNSAVDAVLAGVPAITMDEGSMAWPVTTHDLAAVPVRPDREAWAARLAWCQWSLEEMRSGECWDAVGRERLAA